MEKSEGEKVAGAMAPRQKWMILHGVVATLLASACTSTTGTPPTSALTEWDFAADPALSLQPGQVGVTFMEAMDATSSALPDTETLGVDTVPFVVETAATYTYRVDPADTSGTIAKVEVRGGRGGDGAVLVTLTPDSPTASVTLVAGEYELAIYSGYSTADATEGVRTVFLQRAPNVSSSSSGQRDPYDPDAVTCLLSTGRCPGCNLNYADLSGANLFMAELPDASLFGANLYGANLSKADLSGAVMYEAFLVLANLSGANLSSANLSRAIANSANLSNADLRFAHLYSTQACDANLTNANLTGVELVGASMAYANLTGATLTGAHLYGTIFTYATWTDGKTVCADNSIGTCKLPSHVSMREGALRQ